MKQVERLDEALARLAADEPSAHALDDGRVAITRAELQRRTSRLAACLTARSASTVALAADNGVAWALVALATRTAGLTLVPLAPFFSDEQREHALRLAAPQVLLTDAPATWAARLGAAPSELVEGLALFDRPERAGGQAGCALLSFTSGSTGRPKGIRLPAATLDAVAAALGEATGTGAEERHLTTLPLAVLLEQVGGLERVLRAGGCVAVPPLAQVGAGGSHSLDAAVLLAALQRWGATSAIFVPGALLELVEHLERQSARAPRALRFLGVGGAPVAVELLERAARLGLPVHEGYGLTEAGSVVAVNAPGSARRGSVGRPLPHLQVEIVPRARSDEGAPDIDWSRGSDAPPDGTRRGEIVLTGPLAVGESAASDAADGSQRLATGDLGYLDADGFLHITGRARNLFVTSFGRNVSPEWVERRLLDVPGLHQAVVLGEGLPRPVAVLVAAPGADMALVEGGVRDVCAALPAHARPERWLFAPPLTPADGFWTATGRPRRDAVAAAFLPRLLGAPALAPADPAPPFEGNRPCPI